MWLNYSFVFWISFNCLSVLETGDITSNQLTNDYMCNSNGFYVADSKITFSFIFLKVIFNNLKSL